LINISKENNVVLSTHSIFMIDKKNIERHLIVEKVKESSEIKRANSSNYFEEEVLFQALNCSVFEMLKEKNIIFEGWHDYELFQKCILNNPKQEQLKSNFSSLGLCFGRGAEGLNNIAVIFQAGRRDCVIISDNDEPATRGQREHREKKVLGKWVTYFDLNKDKRILTAEDFIKNTFFEQFLKELNAKIIKLVPGLEELKSTDFQQDKPKIVVLYEWIAKANLKKEELKQVKAEIKNMVFENVTPDDIIDEYFETIKELVRSIS
ncbi:MAG TPA: hypothetical protein VMV05_12570, partial [bacterium]|nr:hypothetical protein [bacterium]